jgi:hypothetical protein
MSLHDDLLFRLHRLRTKLAWNKYVASRLTSTSPGGDNANDPKRPRACEACRSLKVRCDQDPAHPDQPCKRCAKANRQCIITAPSRKRQRKADSRVAELEKKIDAMTAYLHSQGQGRSADQLAQGQFPGGWEGHEPPSRGSGDQAGQKRRRTEDGAVSSLAQDQPRREITPPLLTPGPFVQPTHPQQAQIDPAFSTRTTVGEQDSSPHFPGPHMPANASEKLMDQQALIRRINALVSPSDQNRIFQRYVQDMTRHIPIVIFPPDITADEVRNTKPILFLAVLNGGSVGILDYDIQAAITEEIISQFGDIIIKKGEKSLELIQAIQIACFWFKPPAKTDMTNYYQLIHLGAVMAIDLGMGRRQSAARTKNPTYRRIIYPNSDAVESRRAWLGCYFLCAR